MCMLIEERLRLLVQVCWYELCNKEGFFFRGERVVLEVNSNAGLAPS